MGRLVWGGGGSVVDECVGVFVKRVERDMEGAA
jgi:hypothetical protein